MINTLIEKIKGKGTRIVFTEGSDPRILEAAIRLHKENIVVPVLLGNRAEIAGSAAANGWDIEGIETLDPIEYKNMDMMVTKVIELRKGKLDEAQAREACLHRNFFWYHVCKAWLCGWSARWCYILNSRYCTSCITAD